jgi:acyl carrier protein
VQTPTEQNVRETVHGVIRQLAPDPDVPFEPDARLIEDLGFHSLALLELAFALEDEFDLTPIDQEAAQRITTMRAVADFVVAEIVARDGGLRAAAD